MSKPDLRIIDKAIERIKSGYDWFSCLALQHAVQEIRGSASWDSAEWWVKRYQKQYRLTVLDHNKGRDPAWWNKCPSHYMSQAHRQRLRNSRLAALRRFRKACIDAAKEQQ